MKKQKLSDKFPCECGHSQKLHENVGAPINDGWCNWIGRESSDGDYVLKYTCDCDWYRPDNLKYLEQMSKKTKKGIK